MDRLTRHEAIMAILGVPETYLSKVYKAGIIELLFENVTSLYVPNTGGISIGTRDVDVMYTSKERKGTDNPEMYDRPPNSYISNSSSCG